MGLKDLRVAKNLTQQQLAERAKISRQRLSEYERDIRPPSNMTLAQAVRIADVLKVRDLRKLLEP